MSTIFEDLFKVAEKQGLQPQIEGQTDEQFVTALLFAIAKLPSNELALLKPDSLQWYNDIAQNYFNKKLPFDQWPIPEGFNEFKTGPVKKYQQKQQEDKRKKTVRTVRAMVMMDPNMSARQIHKYLDASSHPGIKFDVVSVICSETRSFIMLAKELGYWREKSIYEGEPPLQETPTIQAPDEGSSS